MVNSSKAVSATDLIRKAKDAKALLSYEVGGLPATAGTPVMCFLAGFPDDHGLQQCANS